jgi:ribosomal protein S18 acetylase RimI-like enzyme
LIADYGGEAVGLGFIEVKTEPTGELIGYLANWGVSTDFQGKGVGMKLLDKAVSILKKMGAEAVRINFGYDVNQKLFEHVVNDMGFKPVAITCEKILRKVGENNQEQSPGYERED